MTVASKPVSETKKRRRRAQYRRWQLGNIEQHRLAARRWRQRNLARIRAVSSAWNKAHKERCEEHRRRFLAKNPNYYRDLKRRQKVRAGWQVWTAVLAASRRRLAEAQG